MDRDFEKMGIYDLRNYARLVGVKAPTTLKRDELIGKINQIIEGNEPKPILTKKGRPPKHKQADEYMLDIILPENMFSQNDNIYKPVPQTINFNNLLTEGSNLKLDNLSFEGYLDDYCKDYGIIYVKGYLSDYSRENIIILRSLIQESNIKTGDFVKGVAKYIQSKNVTLATAIEEVNGRNPVDEINRVNFDAINSLYPVQKLNIENINDQDFKIIDKLCPMTKGARISVECKSECKKQEVVKNILKIFDDNNLNTILISIGDKPENIGELIRTFENVKFVEHLPSHNRENFFKRVEMLVKNACNRVECGEDVALVFYNAKNFINAYKQQKILSLNCNDLQANIIAENKFFDYYNLSKYTENASLTVVAIEPTEYVAVQSNCKLVFEESKTNDVCLDLKKSRTQNMEKILGEKDFVEYKNIVELINSDKIDEATNKLL